MKNHIVIKFLAVLLCAVSLLGAVGSAAGILALTEADLYNKSVDQIRQERLTAEGEALAQNVAFWYTSEILGSMPSEILDRTSPFANSFRSYAYGYKLKDASGEVLESRDVPSGDAYSIYTYKPGGQYMHFVNSYVPSEETAPQAESMPVYHEDNGAVIWDAVPSEGASVCEVQLSFPDSSHGAAGENLGTVFRNQDGFVILRLPGWDLGEETQDAVVTGITLIDSQGQLIYQAQHPDGVGYAYYVPEGAGDMIFQSFYSSDPNAMPVLARATVTEPVATEIPEEITEPATEAPTVPEETVAPTEETEAEEPTEAPTEETSSEKKSKSSKKKKSSAEETKAAAEEVTEPEATADVEAVAPAEETEPGPTQAPTEPSVPEETVPVETEPVMINGKPLEEYQINRDNYYDNGIGEWVTVEYIYLPMPEMTLELYLTPDALTYESSYRVLEIIQALRGYLFPALGICLLLFAVFAVYLCCAAGRKPGTDKVQAEGLNRIPLDLYAGLTVLGVCCIGVVIAEGGEYLLRQNVNIFCAAVTAMAFLASLLIVGFCFAFVAQIKTPGGFWWRNSLVGWCLKLCGWIFKKLLRFCVVAEKWAETKGWRMVKGLFRWIRNVIFGIFRWFWKLLRKIYLAFYHGFEQLLRLLPVTWQWLLVGGVLVLLFIVSIAAGSLFLLWTSVLLGFALVIYSAHCFGILLDTTKKMNKGDLDTQVDDKLMVGAFKEFAHDLNDLAGVAVVAAQKQLKSERMKTELITNVSHDIKTPLTSIINYVDLLQKPHTEEQQEQYLEVLDRQSQRLKKLIDDLMDMSKASTGNMAVDITLVDAVESVNQALGEFADKLERAHLMPVFRHTEPSVAMMADGRLVWRVLSNLLSNAVKYAMPGTRLYIDLMQLEGKVVISLKNISRDELNVDAEELMERFVRGDDSRNTEGSGLGLNIAKSLMELQKGQLQLLVDGDLFKVTLIFPGL